MDVTTKFLDSLIDYVNKVRNNFDQYESAAKEKNPNADYKDTSERKIICSTHITFLEGSSERVHLNDKEKFHVFPIIDTLYVHQKNSSAAYQEIGKRFSFLSHLITIDSD